MVLFVLFRTPNVIASIKIASWTKAVPETLLRTQSP